MSRSMPPIQILEDGYMGADAYSLVVDSQDTQCVAFQAIYTGSPTGEFQVQGSINYDPIKQVGQWDEVDLNTTLSITAAGSMLVDVTNTAIPFLRLKYVFSSGTGTLQVFASGKRFN